MNALEDVGAVVVMVACMAGAFYAINAILTSGSDKNDRFARMFATRWRKVAAIVVAAVLLFGTPALIVLLQHL